VSDQERCPFKPGNFRKSSLLMQEIFCWWQSKSANTSSNFLEPVTACRGSRSRAVRLLCLIQSCHHLPHVATFHSSRRYTLISRLPGQFSCCYLTSILAIRPNRKLRMTWTASYTMARFSAKMVIKRPTNNVRMRSFWPCLDFIVCRRIWLFSGRKQKVDTFKERVRTIH